MMISLKDWMLRNKKIKKGKNLTNGINTQFVRFFHFLWALSINAGYKQNPTKTRQRSGLSKKLFGYIINIKLVSTV